MINILKLSANGRKSIDVVGPNDLGVLIITELGESATAEISVETDCGVFYDPCSKGEINAVASTLLDGIIVHGTAFLVQYKGAPKPENFTSINGTTARIINSLYYSLDQARTLEKSAGVPYTLTEDVFSSKSITHHMQMLLGYDPTDSMNAQINKAASELMQCRRICSHDLWIYCLALDALKDTLFSRMNDSQKTLYNDICKTGCHITVNLDSLTNNGGRNEQTD